MDDLPALPRRLAANDDASYKESDDDHLDEEEPVLEARDGEDHHHCGDPEHKSHAE